MSAPDAVDGSPTRRSASFRLELEESHGSGSHDRIGHREVGVSGARRQCQGLQTGHKDRTATTAVALFAANDDGWREPGGGWPEGRLSPLAGGHSSTGGGEQPAQRAASDPPSTEATPQDPGGPPPRRSLWKPPCRTAPQTSELYRSLRPSASQTSTSPMPDARTGDSILSRSPTTTQVRASRSSRAAASVTLRGVAAS